LRWLAFSLAGALLACGKTVAPPVQPQPAKPATELDAEACGELRRSLGDAAATISSWEKRGGVRKPRFTHWTGKRFGYLARELGEFEWLPISQPTATALRDTWVSLGDSFDALSRALDLGEREASAKIAGVVKQSYARRDTIGKAVEAACPDGEVSGDQPWVPQNRVDAVVSDAMKDVLACYELGLAREPELEGRLVVLFAIDRRGRAGPVADMTLEFEPVETGKRIAPLEDPMVISCVLEVFEGLVFPRPGEGVVQVTYPLVLTPDLFAL